MFLFNLLDFALGLYEMGLVAYVLCAWIAHPAAHAFRRRLVPAYEPVLAPIRRWVLAPRVGGAMIDLSPIFLFIIIGLVRRLVFAIAG